MIEAAARFSINIMKRIIKFVLMYGLTNKLK